MNATECDNDNGNVLTCSNYSRILLLSNKYRGSSSRNVCFGVRRHGFFPRITRAIILKVVSDVWCKSVTNFQNRPSDLVTTLVVVTYQQNYL